MGVKYSFCGSGASEMQIAGGWGCVAEKLGAVHAPGALREEVGVTSICPEFLHSMTWLVFGVFGICLFV